MAENELRRPRDQPPAWTMAENELRRPGDQRPRWAKARDKTQTWTSTEDQLQPRPRDQRPPFAWTDQDQAETQV